MFSKHNQFADNQIHRVKKSVLAWTSSQKSLSARVKIKNMKKLQTALFAISLAAALPASATLLVDRGLPTDNLNNDAGANRANVSWAFTQYTSPNYWVVGDTFANTSSQTWSINQITLWTVGETDTAILRGGIDGSSIGIASSAYSITPATYADGSSYQVPDGNYASGGMHQIDFAVNILLAPGQTYDFFLDGSGSGDGTYVPFVHASNAALSGSPQDGWDNTMLYANIVGGILDPTSIGSWSPLDPPAAWDKPSDVNVQVFGTPVPEPTTMIAGALLLLPFGASTLRMLRKNRTA
jgi:hypothetical protein